MAKPFYALKRLAFTTLLPLALLVSIAQAEEIDLLAYMQGQIISRSPASAAVPDYNRKRHFGGWKRQDPQSPCQNTRASVLRRDSDPNVPVTYTNHWSCTVKTGRWHDPYTGTEVTEASDLQVDHVVPLKAAYYSGAYAWSSPMRCNYMNFMGNDIHLVAVDSHENMSKGDKGPEEYLPPNPADHCRYVNAWMRIKAVWELNTTEAEVRAIEEVFRDQRCEHLMRYMDKSELAVQRRRASAPIEACANRQ